MDKGSIVVLQNKKENNKLMKNKKESKNTNVNKQIDNYKNYLNNELNNNPFFLSF